MARRVLMATAAVMALGLCGVSAASAATLTVCESGPPTCGYSNIQAAINASSSGDTIEIAAGNYMEEVLILNTSFTLTKSLTLQGAGPEHTIIQGVNIGGVDFGAVATITGVTIENGLGVKVAGLFTRSTLTLDNSVVKDNSEEFGAGILNHGTMTLNNSTVSGNRAEKAGGGIDNFAGGTVTLNNSTVRENSAAVGGGIANEEEGGAVTLHNSTVSGNSATDGGGIYNESATLTLNNTKVSSNTAVKKGGGIYNKATVVGSNDAITGNTPDGILNEGVVNLKNSKLQSP
jgi:hypothetical protein